MLNSLKNTTFFLQLWNHFLIYSLVLSPLVIWGKCVIVRGGKDMSGYCFYSVWMCIAEKSPFHGHLGLFSVRNGVRTKIRAMCSQISKIKFLACCRILVKGMLICLHCGMFV